LFQGSRRRKAARHLRYGVEERRAPDARAGPRSRRGQSIGRRRDARHQPQHAAKENTVAQDKNVIPIRTALISVSDKTGLAEFARGLARYKIKILSTGGTARFLADHGCPVAELAEYTGFPEMLDGRVKTLHARIHAGILARRDSPAHLEAIRKAG